MAPDKEPNPISSWSDWFNRAAEVFEDPRMKVAYYQDGSTGTPYSQKAVERTFSHIWDILKPAAGDTVLDVGCGVGFFAKQYAGQVQRIIGTDIAPQMLFEAAKLNPDGTFLACQADALCFKNELFNCVLSYGVTQYLSDLSAVETMLAELLRVLKSPGKILIGDVLDTVEQKDSAYNRQSPKTKHWWPKSLDHDLKKLYVPQKFFQDYCGQHGLRCDIFEQRIKDRQIPTPRYDLLVTKE